MRYRLRQSLVPVLSLCSVFALSAPAAGQGFGIGARIAMVHSDATSNADAVRFVGGQLRLSLSRRMGFEVSLDRHTESFELLNQRVKETPIQASLMLKLASGGFQPYLLGGPGWYTRRVEPIDGALANAGIGVSTRSFGWHAGFGAEIRMGRHAGLHGDYRYTFLDFNNNSSHLPLAGLAGRFLPGYKGSMWTAGVTVYF